MSNIIEINYRRATIIAVIFLVIHGHLLCSDGSSLLRDWVQQGESFDYEAWLKEGQLGQRTPAQSIAELSEAITATPSPVTDMDLILRNLNYFAYRLAQKDSRAQANAFSSILLSPRVAIFEEARSLRHAIYVDADLASDPFHDALTQRLERHPEDPQLISLAGWCLLKGGKERIVNVFKLAQSRHHMAQRWRDDRLLYWAALAAMRFDNEEAYDFWRKAIWSETSFTEMGIGVDLLYLRNPRVVEEVSSLLWKKGVESPGHILEILSRSLDVNVREVISRVPFEERPTLEQYERLTHWLLDPARVYRR